MKIKETFIGAVFFLFLLIDLSNADNFAPENIDGARTINTAAAKVLFNKNYPFIDVRGTDDYKTAHIPGAYHLSIKNDFTEQRLREIVEKDQPVVIYCNGVSCMGSSVATHQAVAWGWSNVFYYREGITEWKHQGYSVQSLDPSN